MKKNEKRIFIVGEADVKGEVFQTDPIAEILDAKTKKSEFDDFFNITEMAEFEKYKDKEEVVEIFRGMFLGYFNNECGVDPASFMVTAIDVDSEIFQFGIKYFKNFKGEWMYQLLDWKADGYVFKYGEMEISGQAVITREEFIKKIESKTEETKYILESEDSGSVYFSLCGCYVTFDLDSGIEGEVTLFKDGMEVTLDFDIIEDISKEDSDSFRLEFNNGMADVILRPAKAD